MPRAAPVVYLAVQAQHPKSHLSNLDIPAVILSPAFPFAGSSGPDIPEPDTWAPVIRADWDVLSSENIWKYPDRAQLCLCTEKLFTLSGVAGKMARFLE